MTKWFAGVTWVAAVSLPLVARSQSVFLMQNISGLVNAPVFDADGQPLEGPNYAAELWGGPSPEVLAPAVVMERWQRYIVPFWQNGYFISDLHGWLAVLNVPPGGMAWLQVRAWDARLGATYEEVVARGVGGYGESPVFYADGADPFLALPEPPARLMGLQSFRLRPVIPEPDPWALAALGAVILICSRRLRTTDAGTRLCCVRRTAEAGNHAAQPPRPVGRWSREDEAKRH